MQNLASTSAHPPIPAAHQLLLPSGSEWPAHGAPDHLPNLYGFSALHAYTCISGRWATLLCICHGPLSPKCSGAVSSLVTCAPAARLPLVPHVIQPKPEITAGGSGPAALKTKPCFDFANLALAATQEDPSKLGRGGPWAPAGGLCVPGCDQAVSLSGKEAHEDACLPKLRRSSVCKFCGRHFTKSHNLLIHERTHGREALHMRHLPQSLPEARPPTRPQVQYYGGGGRGRVQKRAYQSASDARVH